MSESVAVARDLRRDPLTPEERDELRREVDRRRGAQIAVDDVRLRAQRCALFAGERKR